MGCGCPIKVCSHWCSAIATQAWIITTYETRGLELLARGLSPIETIAQLTGEDQGRAHRQVGMIGVRGEAVT